VDDGPGETLVVPDIEPDSPLEAWRVARSTVPVTRRRPIMIITDHRTLEDKVSDGEDPSDFDDLDVAARKIDPWMPPWRLQEDDDPLVAATDLDSHHGTWTAAPAPGVVSGMGWCTGWPSENPVGGQDQRSNGSSSGTPARNGPSRSGSLPG
jgi:hypothetical protein